MNKYFLPSNYWVYLKHNYFPSYKKSYSEQGEDLLMSTLCKKLNIASPTYIDVGTHHPIYSNNTYLFYSRGCRGVCIEPNPDLCKKIRSWRNQDIILNVGVNEKEAPFMTYYVLSATTRSTFNKKEADRLVNSGFCTHVRHMSIPLTTVDMVIKEYFTKKCPDIVSIDTEGYDADALRSISLDKNRPAIFCVETLTYDSSGKEYKNGEVSNILHDHGYAVYADTHVNTIFFDSIKYSL